MAAGPQVVVEFLANTEQLTAAGRQVGATATGAGAAAKKAFLPAVAALGLITAGAKTAIDAASALNEQMSASQQVFGKHAKGIQDWAKTGAQSFGMSQREALGAANAFGNMAQAAGLTTGESAAMSKSMVQLAGDMASFHDQDPTEMLRTLQSGLAGEAEPLRKFGVLLSEAAVKQKAYQMGLAKTGSELTEAQKVQARYALIMESTTKAQGDFARTGDSVANQQRKLAAETENTAAAFGQALLPAMQALQSIFSSVLGIFRGNQGALTAIVGVVAALAAGIVVLNAAMTVYRAIQLVATAVTWLQTTAMTALAGATLAATWPILAVVAGIVALIAIIVLLIVYWDQVKAAAIVAWNAIKAAAMAAWQWIKQNWPLIVGVLTGPIGMAVVLIIRYWDQIKAAVGAAANWIRGVWNQVTGALSSAMSAASNAIRGAWDRVENAARGAVDFIRGLWSALTGFLSSALSGAAGAVTGAWNRIKSAATGVIDAIEHAWQKLVGTVSSITGKITAFAQTARNAVNFVVDRWNSLSIPGIHIKVPGPGPLPDLNLDWGGWDSPNIGRLAQGGIVTKPMLSLIGEAGPEAVIPLSGSQPAIEVRVFIGDQELRGMVRTEIVDADTRTARTILAGAR